MKPLCAYTIFHIVCFRLINSTYSLYSLYCVHTVLYIIHMPRLYSMNYMRSYPTMPHVFSNRMGLLIYAMHAHFAHVFVFIIIKTNPICAHNGSEIRLPHEFFRSERMLLHTQTHVHPISYRNRRESEMQRSIWFLVVGRENAKSLLVQHLVKQKLKCFWINKCRRLDRIHIRYVIERIWMTN